MRIATETEVGAGAATPTPTAEELARTSRESVSGGVSVDNVPDIDGWDLMEVPDFDLGDEDGDGEIGQVPVEVADRAAARWVTLADRLADVHDRAETQLADLKAAYEARKALIEEWSERRTSALMSELEYCERILTTHAGQHLAGRDWKALSLSYPAGVTAAFRSGRGTLKVTDPAALAEWLTGKGAAHLVTRQVRVTVDSAGVKRIVDGMLPKMRPGDRGDQHLDLPGAEYDKTAYAASVNRPRR